MYEKILQKLKKQRKKTSNVSDRSLEDLARNYENFITSDEVLEKTDFVRVIESIDGNINKMAADAVKTASEKAEEERKQKEEETKRKKEQEELDKMKSAGDDKKSEKKEDEIPAWAKALIDQNERLSNSFLQLQQKEVLSTRKQRLEDSLKGVPKFFSNSILASFEKTNFENEEDFSAYMEVVKQDKEDFIQSAKENGLNFSTPSTQPKKEEKTNETPLLSDAMRIAREAREKQEKVNN